MVVPVLGYAVFSYPSSKPVTLPLRLGHFVFWGVQSVIQQRLPQQLRAGDDRVTLYVLAVKIYLITSSASK